MGNMKKITDYTEVIPNSQDVLLINQNGSNKKTTVEKLLDGVNSSLSDITKIYTNNNKSDLGLTFPATTTQIIEAMVDNSILSITADKSTILSDAPGNYGHLYIFKSSGRSAIEFNQFTGMNGDAIPNIVKFIGSYMSSTTTKFSGWKLIATTDDVAVNTNSITTINTKLADTGWIDITLNAGFTSRGVGYTPQYRKIGNRIYLRGQLVGDLTTSVSSIATLPTGFRPSAEQTINGILNSTCNYYGWISTSGAINLKVTTNMTSAGVSLSSIPSFLVD